MNEVIFKAYDIRGIYPGEINEEDVYKIAKAYCEFVKPKEVTWKRGFQSLLSVLHCQC